MGEFTEQEKRLLQPYFTNLDKRVFVLKNLPQVVCGTLFSRYSRSKKPLRRLLLDEFMEKPEFEFDAIVGKRQGGESEIIVVAELPGVEKEELKVRVKGKTLTIDVDNPQRPYHKEISLPAKVRKEDAKSSMRNGVLEVRLKKA